MLIEYTMPKEDNESSEKHCEETNIYHPLVELLEQFWQCKDQFTSLKSTTSKSTPMAELMHLTDKLQHLTVMLQPHSATQPSKKPVHKIMQHYTDTLCAMQRESNLTMTMLQDVPTFARQDSSKLEDWFMVVETAADILT